MVTFGTVRYQALLKAVSTVWLTGGLIIREALHATGRLAERGGMMCGATGIGQIYAAFLERLATSGLRQST